MFNVQIDLSYHYFFNWPGNEQNRGVSRPPGQLQYGPTQRHQLNVGPQFPSPRMPTHVPVQARSQVLSRAPTQGPSQAPRQAPLQSRGQVPHQARSQGPIQRSSQGPQSQPLGPSQLAQGPPQRVPARFQNPQMPTAGASIAPSMMPTGAVPKLVPAQRPPGHQQRPGIRPTGEPSQGTIFEVGNNSDRSFGNTSLVNSCSQQKYYL